MVKNKITLNVLADISRRIGGESYAKNKEQVLIVFTGSNIDLKGKIEELKRFKEKGIDFSLAFSFMGERILDVDYIINSLKPIKVYREEDIFQLEDIVNSHSSVIGANITMNTLSKVTLGMVDSFISNIIWTFLYKEKPVYLDFASVRSYLGSPSNNKVIRDLIEEGIDKIKRMGAVEINIQDYGKKLLNENLSQPDYKVEDKQYNKVITEKDLLNHNSKAPLVIRKGTIITPLAKDKAKELGIRLEMEK
ncbi:flavoprotein [Tepidimicrobium xylanilyticum]